MLLTNGSTSCKSVCAQTGFALAALAINFLEVSLAFYVTALGTSYAANLTHGFWQQSRTNGMIFAIAWSAVLWAAFFACGFFTNKLLAKAEKFPPLRMTRAIGVISIAPWIAVLGLILTVSEVSIGSVTVIGALCAAIIGAVVAGINKSTKQ